MTPVVSVIIPCFNLGAYVDEAVQSVLRQTYQDVEIVIVDDGSDDPATQHLLTSYQRPRTRVIRTENAGLSRARNRGLEEASGRYVSFLDADDLFEAQFLERTVSLLDARPDLAFASCWLTGFGAQSFSWTPERCDFPWLLAEDTVCTAALTRSEAARAVGGFDPDTRVDGYQDWAFAIMLVEQGFPGEIIREPLFRYRIRAGSMTSWCTTPERHARVVEYLVDKHAATYRAQAEEVVAAIAQRTGELEAALSGSAPARPASGLAGSEWRTTILALENHRRKLEEMLKPSTPVQPTNRHEGVDWGSLRRLEPISRTWGLDRGQPIDRYYIERFLESRADEITGDVLEVKDPYYTTRFQRGARSVSVLDVADHNQQATLVADLSQPGMLAEDSYDCIILTQTIQFVFDLQPAIANLHRALTPGGVLLATVPCVSRIDYESGIEGDFWRLTKASAERLFASEFASHNVQVDTFGSVLTCMAFLQGLASSELEPAELDRTDPYFPLLITIRATKGHPRQPVKRRPVAIEGSVDEVSCNLISGWAWNREAPEQRLRLELWDNDVSIGSVWANDFRQDLADAGKGGGRVAFSFTPVRHPRREPPIELRVTPAGSAETVPGTPRPVVCRCGEPGVVPVGLRGAAIDSPRRDRLPFPRLQIAGWALGEDGPVQAMELFQHGEMFSRLAVDRPRPDVAAAFSDFPWAARAGFETWVSLLGTAGTVELEVQAVLVDGERATVARIEGRAAEPPATPVIVVVDGTSTDRADGIVAPEQTIAATRGFVRGLPNVAGHPGFTSTGEWNHALEGDGLIWLCDGEDGVKPDFLKQALAGLGGRAQASFVVAVEPGGGVPEPTLITAMDGSGLGCSIVFRASAVSVVGGFDEHADSAAAAQWDLAIRLAEAGHDWIAVEAAIPSSSPLSERAGEHVTRWLYRKHAALYQRELRPLLLEREAIIGELLRSNHLVERRLETELRPQVLARRQERDRLGARLRRAARDGPRTPAAGDRGDFERWAPVSPTWGSDRGLCVDRYYIERFLERHASDIHGTVLEWQDPIYARRYASSRLDRCDILDIDPANALATVVADLCRAPEIASSRYDCLILTQVLYQLEDPGAALAECRRILRPGGVLLLSTPTVAALDREAVDRDRWRFSADGLRGLLERSFGGAELDVRGEGNAAAITAFLTGLAAEEVGQEALDRHEPGAQLVATARAVNPEVHDRG